MKTSRSKLNICIKLLAGFFIIIGLTVLVGVMAMSRMSELAEITENLYRHPYAVRTTVSDIKGSIIAMHRSMKDVVLATDAEDIRYASDMVSGYEDEIYHYFEILDDRYLGDPETISYARQLFVNWEPIRSKVIALMYNGDRLTAANITKTDGKDHISTIDAALEEIAQFAEAKGEEYIASAAVTKKQAKNAIIIMLAAALISGMLIAANHDLNAVICNIFGVSERELTMARLKEQATLLDITHDAIGVIKITGEITYWNSAAEYLYGWSATEMQGQDISMLASSRDDAIMDAREMPYDTILESGRWIGELKHTTKAGVEVIVESRVCVVLDDQDQPSAFLFSNTDITEKKRLGLQILRTQRMESLGALAGGIAHDLNNVLGPILMSLHILKQKLSNGEGSKIIDTLENNARRGADIIKQILTFARGTKGEFGIVQPKHILGEIANIIKETFPKSISLKTEFPKNLWTIYGDPTQLHQVLLNLSVNARDAMPKGGDLSLKATNVFIDKDDIGGRMVGAPGPYVRFEVQDQGTGMTPEVLDEIFEPFFTTKAEGEGTGLGLATVNSIVESHHGWIVVDSAPDEGTTFRVYFPASQDINTSQPDDAPNDIPLGNDELILIADDDVPSSEITKETLESFGYRVITAVDGLEAITLFAENKNEISVVITDMEMPVMDGLATIKALKRRYPEVKIIAASGHLSDSAREGALAAGASIFLQKPFLAEALLKSLAVTLAK